MGHTLDNATWRKSSYSGSNGGNCVEVAMLPEDSRAVRDSKDPGGPNAEVQPLTSGGRSPPPSSAVNSVSTEPPTIRPRQGHFVQAVVVAETRWFFLLCCRVYPPARLSARTAPRGCWRPV